MYRSLVVVGPEKEKMVVAFVDSGADETVISEALADELGVKLYGTYRSYSASGHKIEGRFAQVKFKDEDLEIDLEVGVSDIPFGSEYSDEEGVDVILGVDFLQDAGVKLDFVR